MSLIASSKTDNQHEANNSKVTSTTEVNIEAQNAYLTKDDSIGSLAHLSHAQTLLHLAVSVNND